MAELQSMIERRLQKKAHDLKEINSIILSDFLEFQKQKEKSGKLSEFQKDNQELRQELQKIEMLANAEIQKIQFEMYLCEREYISDMEDEEKDMQEQEIDSEFENVPVVSTKKRVKSKPTKKAKAFDRKFVMNILNSNSKTTDKLPRAIIEQTLHRRTKPKYKNRSL
jgi:hypothetical protein